MPEQTYLEAIRSGLAEELRRDSSVYVFGEDVALGGPFGATKGLAEEFGANRIVNTPISEGTVMGLAIGAATAGLRPVVEIMFIDFITLAMDQLVNHAAKLHYMSGGQLSIPLTVRVQCGISGAMGAHHSQSLEAWLAHVPGLKIVMPSNPADAKGLLKTAIRDDNPVVFVEHRGLYWSKGQVTDADDLVPIGKAKILRPGDQLTIVALSSMVAPALAAAEELASSGIVARSSSTRPSSKAASARKLSLESNKKHSITWTVPCCASPPLWRLCRRARRWRHNSCPASNASSKRREKPLVCAHNCA